MDLGLMGRTILITGGSGGIGRGLVIAFAREGANVVSADIDSGDKLIEEGIRQGLPGTILPIIANITTRDGVEELMELTNKRFGPVGVLVNNAGGTAKLAHLEDLDDETRHWNIAINVDGMINCTLAAGTDMLAHGKGSIINISSLGALSGTAAHMNAHYAGAKGFVNSFGKAVATEWGNRGVRVNTIAPGLIVPHSSAHVQGAGSWWNRLTAQGRPEDYADTSDSKFFRQSGAVIPRVGRPEDVAYLALFLASDVSSYVTGQIISVSGGSWMP
jgi:NAD(P)-dependent dehydrogenase (short-subunit alcohol dehydrogenase family)